MITTKLRSLAAIPSQDALESDTAAYFGTSSQRTMAVVNSRVAGVCRVRNFRIGTHSNRLGLSELCSTICSNLRIVI